MKPWEAPTELCPTESAEPLLFREYSRREVIGELRVECARAAALPRMRRRAPPRSCHRAPSLLPDAVHARPPHRAPPATPGPPPLAVCPPPTTHPSHPHPPTYPAALLRARLAFAGCSRPRICPTRYCRWAASTRTLSSSSRTAPRARPADGTTRRRNGAPRRRGRSSSTSRARTPSSTSG